MNESHLSVAKMFWDAAPIGKAVMVSLMVGSIWCWVIIIEGAASIFRLRRALRLEKSGRGSPLLAHIFQAGNEAAALVIDDERVGERRGRIEEAMLQEARALMARLEGGLPNLAVISSVAPFVGLFGTVWGIMTSFAGIAESKDTSLAIVAPGISEALAATAIGLAAAIPASIGYTRLGAFLAHDSQAVFTLVEKRAVSLVASTPVRKLRGAA